MKRYALTPLAEADVMAIWAFIAADSIDAADRVELEIYEACEFLAKSPLRGHVRKDLTKRNLRFWTLTRYPNYIVVCVPGKRPVRILAVLHSKQNLKRILSKRL